MKFLSFTVTVSALLFSSVKTWDDDANYKEEKYKYKFIKADIHMESEFQKILSKVDSTKIPEFCYLTSGEIEDTCMNVVFAIMSNPLNGENNHPEEKGNNTGECIERKFHCKFQHCGTPHLINYIRECTYFYLMAFGDHIYVLSSQKDRLYFSDTSTVLYLYGLVVPSEND